MDREPLRDALMALAASLDAEEVTDVDVSADDFSNDDSVAAEGGEGGTATVSLVVNVAPVAEAVDAPTNVADAAPDLDELPPALDAPPVDDDTPDSLDDIVEPEPDKPPTTSHWFYRPRRLSLFRRR